MSHSLFRLLRQLDESNISYALSRHRENSILVSITFVGERTEVDVFEDGHMEVSRFFGDESVVGDAQLIDELINQDSGLI